MKKPNVIMVMTDQQSLWTLSSYAGADSIINTPGIDKLAKEGALFSNYFTNSAVCTPSRGCIFTGRYPHSHGAFMNDMELGRDEITLAHILKQNGYETGYIGKWHLDGSASNLINTFSILGKDPGEFGISLPKHKRNSAVISPNRSMGFEHCEYMFEIGHGKKVIENPDNSFDIINSDIGDENSYTTDWLFNKASEFIQTGFAKPFFLVLSIPDPHDPYTVRPPYDTMFEPSEMSIPSTFYDEKPVWLKTKNAVHWTSLTEGMTEENLKRVKAKYCGQVKCIDDNVVKLLNVLDQNNLTDDTMIIFTTDHGEYMGEHGIMYKNQLFETAYHIPLVIRYPHRIAPGTVIENFISTVDLHPTVLGILGLSPCGREQGRDASALFDSADIPWDDEVYIYSTLKHRAGIITPEYQLSYVIENEDNLLFDRINDPLQKTNLYYDDRYSGIRKALKNKMLSHNIRIDAPEVKWLSDEKYL